MRQWKVFWANENGVFSRKIVTGIDELKKVINDYVRYYNEERIQLKLKGLSPIQYRKQSFK